MTYVIKPVERDYADLFHRRLVTIPERVADQFLYARFAYSISKQYRSPEFSDLALPINVAVEEAREYRLKRTQEKADRQKGFALETVHEDQGGDICTYDILLCIWS